MISGPPFDMQRFRDGDGEYLRELVLRYSPRIHALAARYARDEDAALDFVQETWIRAYERRATLRSSGAFVAWLLALCHSVCISRGTRLVDRRREVPIVHASDVAETGDGPLAVLEAADRQARLADAVLRLPHRQRQVVIMRVIENCSTRDTATALGCAEGTVKATLHQAITRLRQILPDAEF